ncbi:hypothetical protein WL29_20485 [Burkholderia ubonensis]|uniref:Uncharacterized protein n=1 Tax=Burkholderia ubonensis TaxID=101571 RepID=A0A119HFD2_9BURK|nr:hypothetical protein [Burkholderia ubonensis]KWA83745.1 hypothetical protein WL29_20485 [Burkholderia ubonensis]
MTRITKDAAREALDSMDDFARMTTSVDASGPRGVLERFIAQAMPVTEANLQALNREREVVLHPVSQVEAWAEDLRNEPNVGAINGGLIIQMLHGYAALLKVTTRNPGA